MAESAKAFVTGYPVNHTRSPHIHRYWLDFYGISGSYEKFETTEETFPVFMGSLCRRGFCGGNITLPHKERACSLVEKCDDVAVRIGAVNTLWFENGVLHGTNTDAYGFTCNLDDFAPGWEKDTALVIGAGGASRAVIFALKRRGFQRIILANRTRARAEKLADNSGDRIIVVDWQYINEYLREAEFIVNTTSLGMTVPARQHDDANNHPVPDFTRARPDAIVTDIVYTPLITPLLRRAEEAGLKTVDGIGMLLHQAVPGFERWFGIKPQVTRELRSRILSTLGEAV